MTGLDRARRSGELGEFPVALAGAGRSIARNPGPGSFAESRPVGNTAASETARGARGIASVLVNPSRCGGPACEIDQMSAL